MAIRSRGSGAVVVVNINHAAVARMTNPGGQVDVYTKGKAESIKVKARQIVPVKSGRLRNSIKVQQSHDLKGQFTSGYEVAADAPYAAFVHDGTRPHVIEGNPLLVFQVGGTTVFARKVNHPGTRGNPFLLRATQTVLAGSRR